jgi:glutathione gamma-glutamylcysteinyltransferase
MTHATSFYRRPLPDGHVAFSGPQGRELFREALAAGTLEGFFALSEQFHTQAEPAYCGLGSLVVALNALGIDPGRLWKGPWRWFDESLLDCCVPLDQVRARGLTLDELGCLASCNGARSTVVRASDATVESFRDALGRASESSEAVVIASYHRGALGQTGQGHFSPLGGIHRERDLALVLDVARFKYPPHWVPIERLFAAMLPVDPATSRSRGWIELVAEPRPRPIFLQIGMPSRDWVPLLQRLTKQARSLDVPLEVWALAMAREVPELADVVRTLAEAFESELEPEHRDLVDQLLAQVRATPTYRALVELAPPTAPTSSLASEALTVLAYVLGSPSIDIAELGPPLADEVAALRRQVAALCSPGHVCEPGPEPRPLTVT